MRSACAPSQPEGGRHSARLLHVHELIAIEHDPAECGEAVLLGELTRTTGRPLTVAYAPHVATERLQAAQNAGFAAVLSRGQAASQLQTVLERVLANSKCDVQ